MISKTQLVSFLLMKSGALTLGARLLRRNFCVLAFHRIGIPQQNYTGDKSLFSMSTDEFRKFASWCSRHFDVCTFSEIGECVRSGKNPKRPKLVFSFDDGYVDSYTEVAPILENLGLNASFFIAPNLIEDESSRWWDALAMLQSGDQLLMRHGFQDRKEALKAIKTRPYYETAQFQDDLKAASRQKHSERQMMTWDMIRDLHRRGHEIGAHTMTHRVLSTLSPDEQQSEILDSRLTLELHLGSSIASFAYPVGGSAHFSNQTVELVRAARFGQAAAYGVRHSWNPEDSNAAWYIPRIAISGSAEEAFARVLGLWERE
jgi:peptidoglycan/xylan/chitin deacetylase (PgdA/CDA1 family)